MIFTETPLRGSFLIDLEWLEDERGAFARAFCVEEFRKMGLRGDIAQANLSFNERCGTLRGMHYQRAPDSETKVVRVARGRVFDVIVDLRRDSSTYTQWFGAELDDETGRALYVPSGFAHGFLTLQAKTEVSYLMGTAYVAGAAAGVRYDDPVFGIKWPAPPVIVSERDLAFAPFVA
jgi:dTDP-4-dehydrorhamnose 3,5-epimerase